MTILWPGETNPGDIRPEILKALELCLDVQDSGMARWMGYEGYVQWAGWPEGVQIECSGAPTIPGVVTPEGARLMSELGFQPPNQEIPNWWRRITVRGELATATDALITCLFEVLNPELAPISPVASPRESARGGVITLAPVGKLGTDDVRRVAALIGQELAFAGPVLVLDAYDFAGCAPELTGFTRMSFAEFALTHPDPRPGLDRILVHGLEKRKAAAELFAAAEVARAVYDARYAGWTVLLIGPPAFFPWHWIYEQAALPLTDGLIVLRETHQRREGYHDQDAAVFGQLNPDRWNDPLHIEVRWNEESEPAEPEGPVLSQEVLDGAEQSPAWLRGWLRYFAP